MSNSTIDHDRFTSAAEALAQNYAWKVILAEIGRRRDAALATLADTLAPSDQARFQTYSEIAGHLPGFSGSPKNILAQLLRPSTEAEDFPN